MAIIRKPAEEGLSAIDELEPHDEHAPRNCDGDVPDGHVVRGAQGRPCDRDGIWDGRRSRRLRRHLRHELGYGPLQFMSGGSAFALLMRATCWAFL
jgi:hypothetical protein